MFRSSIYATLGLWYNCHMSMPSKEKLFHLFDYNPDNGELRWKNPPREFLCGKIAGCSTPSGYRIVRFNRKPYFVHRIVWKMCNGVEPEGQIDHINHIRDDNRIKNLRVVTNRENSQNRVDQSGFGCGVQQHGTGFRCRVSHRGEKHHVGTFRLKEVASEAYDLAQWFIDRYDSIPHADYFYSIFGKPRNLRSKHSSLGTGVRCVGIKFQARIKHAGVFRKLGTYETPQAAAAAYAVARWCKDTFGYVPSRESIREIIPH